MMATAIREATTYATRIEVGVEGGLAKREREAATMLPVNAPTIDAGRIPNRPPTTASIRR